MRCWFDIFLGCLVEEKNKYKDFAYFYETLLILLCSEAVILTLKMHTL
jgi:hypothetical protein